MELTQDFVKNIEVFKKTNLPSDLCPLAYTGGPFPRDEKDFLLRLCEIRPKLKLPMHIQKDYWTRRRYCERELKLKPGTILIVPFFYGAFHAGLYISVDKVIHLAP